MTPLRRCPPSVAIALLGAATSTWIALVPALSAQVAGEPTGTLEAVQLPPLFASDTVLAVTIEADFSTLVDDRSASPDRQGVIVVEGRRIPTRIRTRGNFRLDPANCSFPPLRIEVDEAAPSESVLVGQDELKIVSSCRPGRDRYDELVLLEYLAYRSYALLTPEAFQVRLVDLTLVDETGGRETATRPAFFIEEDKILADRLGASVFDLEDGRNLPSTAFQARAHIRAAVFEYMIGNTDWSAVAGHNIEILERDGGALPVPYDFDSSGLVDAPYATVDPDLGLSSPRERRYRGWCSNDFVTALVLQEFRDAEGSILDLWNSTPLLSDDGRQRAVRYLEGFYEDIETDDRARRRFLRDCRR